MNLKQRLEKLEADIPKAISSSKKHEEFAREWLEAKCKQLNYGTPMPEHLLNHPKSTDQPSAAGLRAQQWLAETLEKMKAQHEPENSN